MGHLKEGLWDILKFWVSHIAGSLVSSFICLVVNSQLSWHFVFLALDFSTICICSLCVSCFRSPRFRSYMCHMCYYPHFLFYFGSLVVVPSVSSLVLLPPPVSLTLIIWTCILLPSCVQFPYYLFMYKSCCPSPSSSSRSLPVFFPLYVLRGFCLELYYFTFVTTATENSSEM